MLQATNMDVCGAKTWSIATRNGRSKRAPSSQLLSNLVITRLAEVGPVAQGIEQWFPKPCAACSNHAGATKMPKRFHLWT